MLRRMEEDGLLGMKHEEIRDVAEGAFNVLARFSTMTYRAPQSPLSRWRRSAIRIAASSSARKLREMARLKALQRTPYPLVLARIKLLLDRLTVFKEHVTAVSSAHATGGANSAHGGIQQSMSKIRRRLGTGMGSTSWGDSGLGDGVGRQVAVAAAAAAAAAASAAVAPDLADVEGGEDDHLVTSAIKNWDLRRVGGHMPSGPMENLFIAGGDTLSRKPSRMTRESRSPAFSDDDDDTSGSFATRLRRSPSPTRSITGTGGATSAYSAAASVNLRSIAGATGGGGGAGSPDGIYLDDSPLGDFDGGMALDDPGSGNKMSLDKLLEELSTTMSYVSDFLRKVPEETRMEACFAAKMDNYKKDQTVYRIGDPPERFHLILTGVVEIWTHPPGNRREKTLIATLKKGQSFGEMAILNDEPRAEVATPTSNCTFLTFHRADLLSCFGPFFRERLLAAEKFFHSRVAVFQAMPKSGTMKVISHMMQSTFPAGKDWEPQGDQQIYFIKSGAATLEALDRRTVPSTSPSSAAATTPTATTPTGGPGAGGAGGGAAAGTAGGAGGGASGASGASHHQHHQAIGASGSAAISATRGASAAAASAAAGGAAGLEVPELPEENEVLAAISIVDGRAVGTLGHEDELRRLRRAAIPKKAVATLEPGAHFGGGTRVLGEGELQSCMKVTANTEITVYHMHIDQFFKCAPPDLVRALRDDTAFKLTYYFGRLGTIGQDIVVGHVDSSLASVRGHLQVGEDEDSALAQARGASGPRKKKGVKKTGAHSSEVEKALNYMADLEAELDNPGSKNLDLYKHGTPVERYYRSPLLCGTARGNALPNLIAGVYGEGLAPLADKVDALAAKAARRLDQHRGDQPAVRRMMSIMAPVSPAGHAPLSSPSGGGASLHPRGSPSQRHVGYASTNSTTNVGGGVGGSGGSAARPASPSRVASRLGIRPPSLALDGGGAGATTATAGDSPSLAFAAVRSPLASPAHRGISGGGVGRPRSSPNSVAIGSARDADAGGGGGGGGVYGHDDGSLTPTSRRSGALTAAGFMWLRMRDINGRAPPQIRQCLTYDEIAHIKTESLLAMSTSSGGAPASPGGGAYSGGGAGGGGAGGRLQFPGSGLSTTQSGMLAAAGGAGVAAAAAASGGGGLAPGGHSGAFGAAAAAAALGGTAAVGGSVGTGVSGPGERISAGATISSVYSSAPGTPGAGSGLGTGAVSLLASGSKSIGGSAVHSGSVMGSGAGMSSLTSKSMASSVVAV